MMEHEGLAAMKIV